MKKVYIYFSGIFLLVVLFARSMAIMASYFLGHDTLHRISSALVIILSFSFAYFIVGKYLKFGKWTGSIILLLLIAQSASPFFFYWFRPYTLYYSVLLFSNIFLAGIIAGFFTRNIIGKSSGILNYRLYFISSSLVILIFIIPVFYEIYLLPLLIAFGYLGIYILYLLQNNKSLKTGILPALLFLIFGVVYPRMPEIVFFDQQSHFEDKIIFSAESEHFEITLTQWMDDYWLYLDQLKNISTIDEFLYYEPFVHATAPLVYPRKILILGGENGCLVRELLNYNSIRQIDLVPYDTTLLNISRNHPVFLSMNKNSLANPKVNIRKGTILSFITGSDSSYDMIYVDTPDPRDLGTNQFYTRDFYEILKSMLHKDGLVITQAGSPYFATKAFLSIEYTLQEADFRTFAIHNQILTLGEWGWIIGSLSLSSEDIARRIRRLDLKDINTRWLNQEALSLISSFGKDYIEPDSIGINTLENPVLYRYYLEGTWDLD